MKFNYLPYLLATILLFSCSKEQDLLEEENANLQTTISQELLTIAQINNAIDKALRENGNFDWKTASDQLLWSAAVRGEGILTIGYGNTDNSFRTAEVPYLTAIKNAILNEVATLEQNENKKEYLFYEDPVLNVVEVKITSLNTITQLRKRGDIRYLEPNGYSFFSNEAYPQDQRSSSGCDFNGQNLNNNDFRSVVPGALVSWTFDQHNVEQAWAFSTGAGVTVGLIDTGLSQYQPLLGSNFNDGFSSGRTVQKFGTFIDSPWWWSNNYDGPNDKCGHGTSMASAIAAPRNNDNLPLGVAYNCNLVSYRATEDVVLNDYHERKGVRDALVELGNRSDVKIISMSIGYPWSIGNVRDAVRYAYNRGKLIFAAGGTSLTFTNWYPVIFPANMPECVAVTGITDSGTYQQCDTCHDGSEIEFTIVMERDNDNSRTGTVLGFYNGDRDYVGGSSVATATTAGIAALVWAKYPNWSRNQVLQRLRESAEFYPNKSNTKGYGNLDALEAVQ